MNKKELQMYFSCRLYETLFPEGIFNSGMGQVVIARITAGGAIVGVTFLCDHYCLGVKDCLPFLQSEREYKKMIDKLAGPDPLKVVEPGYAKKYLLDLVAWAKAIGFEPHSDYKFCREILAGIVPDSNATFEFGYQGVPMYMNGPYDTPERMKAILATLQTYEEKTGNKTHHTLVSESPSLLENITQTLHLPGRRIIQLPSK